MAKNLVLMKTSFIKKNLGISITDALFGIVIFSAIYGSYLYIPLVYKSQELQDICKDYTFKAGGATPEVLRNAVIEDAKRRLEITLNPDDVIVTRENDRVKIKATWHAAVIVPVIDYPIPRDFTVEYERKQLW
jgi:hypothetical protein